MESLEATQRASREEQEKVELQQSLLENKVGALIQHATHFFGMKVADIDDITQLLSRPRRPLRASEANSVWREQVEKEKAKVKVKRQRVAIRALKHEVDCRCGEVSKLERELSESERRHQRLASQEKRHKRALEDCVAKLSESSQTIQDLTSRNEQLRSAVGSGGLRGATKERPSVVSGRSALRAEVRKPTETRELLEEVENLRQSHLDTNQRNENATTCLRG
jgi:chromosome segregation ATPase